MGTTDVDDVYFCGSTEYANNVVAAGPRIPDTRAQQGRRPGLAGAALLSMEGGKGALPRTRRIPTRGRRRSGWFR